MSGSKWPPFFSWVINADNIMEPRHVLFLLMCQFPFKTQTEQRFLGGATKPWEILCLNPDSIKVIHGQAFYWVATGFLSLFLPVNHKAILESVAALGENLQSAPPNNFNYHYFRINTFTGLEFQWRS